MMMDDSNADLGHFELHLDDSNEVNAMTLTTLLNSRVEEALSTLSPAQLMQLEKNVQRLKTTKKSSTPARKKKDSGASTPNSAAKRSYDDVSLEDDEVVALPPLHHVSMSPSAKSHHSTNLPASAPAIELRDGLEYLVFTYSTKGVFQEFSIRTDIDHIGLDEIPEEFKTDNCVYPRAHCARDQYIGNRWEYETACNDLAWRLTWINPHILAGKRGLIQRAVDSYRNRFQESRSRRVVRQEKMANGTLRRRTIDSSHSSSSNTPTGDRTQKIKQITLQYMNKGVTAKMRIRVDIENVHESDVDEGFRHENYIYPPPEENEAIGARRDYEMACNEISWKLAFLNQQKLAGKKSLLQKAVDAYRAFVEESKMKRNRMSSTSSGLLDGDYEHHDGSMDMHGRPEEFSEIVANTLQQALSHHDLAMVGELDMEGGDHEALHYADEHHHHHSHLPPPHAFHIPYEQVIHEAMQNAIAGVDLYEHRDL